MKKALLLLVSVWFVNQTIYAQSLTTVTGKRLYEHHSPSIAGPLGMNGFQSGYDFMSHAYVSPFNPNNMAPYSSADAAIIATIDMVEHNGPYGTGGPFGFTSGISTIWGGAIKGNENTKWMEAPSWFNYTSVATLSEIIYAYDDATADLEINAAENNKVYIGRIRNSELYVAVRCYNVTNGNDNYFDFDYKYGVSSPTLVQNIEKSAALSIYPNPASEQIMLDNILQQSLIVKIVSLTGQQVQSMYMTANEVKKLDISTLPNGCYTIICTTNDGNSYIQRFMKQ